MCDLIELWCVDKLTSSPSVPLASRSPEAQAIWVAANGLLEQTATAVLLFGAGGMVAPAQADGSKRALLSQPTISLKGSGALTPRLGCQCQRTPTCWSGCSKVEVRLYRLSSVSQFIGKEAVREIQLYSSEFSTYFRPRIERRNGKLSFYLLCETVCFKIHV